MNRDSLRGDESSVPALSGSGDTFVCGANRDLHRGSKRTPSQEVQNKEPAEIGSCGGKKGTGKGIPNQMSGTQRKGSLDNAVKRKAGTKSTSNDRGGFGE